jgi:putative Mg2+ transporter-C (MgtC) family protein
MISNLEFVQMLAPVLGYSTLCGAIVGFERGRRGSAAGMKTQVFICTGSALFTICSEVLVADQGTGDAGRMIAQIVSGVGFLGAGTIMARDRIIGLTTAAIIWVMASLGVMVGIGYGPAALLVAVGMVVSIEIITQIEKRFVQPHAHSLERRQSPQLHLLPQDKHKDKDSKAS